MIVFRRMNSSFAPRHLSLFPFLAADAGLLLTAALIAWRTPEELAGGALLGVVACVALGAVLLVLPFIINDAREREAALAERQREMVALMETTTANAARWGTQWAAAATGLEDAAGLAARSIATAERLPVVFQEKIDGLAQKLAQAESDARKRVESAGELEAALAERAKEIGTASAVLQGALADFGRVEAGLGEQRAALDAVLAEVGAATGRAQAARAGFEEKLAGVPAQIEAQVARVAAEAGIRLSDTAERLERRFAEMETAGGALLEELKRAAAREPAAVTAGEAIVERLAAVEEALVKLAEQRAVPAADVPAVPAGVTTVVVEPVVVVSDPVPPSVVVAPVEPARSETIMDPFMIPEDGYASLAEAIDATRG